MGACSIVYTFYIFRMFKVARIFDKNFWYDGYGVKKTWTQHFARGLTSAPEVYIRFNVAQFFKEHSRNVIIFMTIYVKLKYHILG